MPLFPDTNPSELAAAARRFASAAPAVAPSLASRSEDPITELLADGLGTLGATLLDRVKDTQRSAYEMLADRCCPWLRRPVPSGTIVAFEPPTTGRYVVAHTSELQSVPVEGVRCTFRPVQAVLVTACRAESAQIEVRRGRTTVLRFAVRSAGIEPVNGAIAGGLTLFVDGDLETALQVAHAATADAARVTVEAPGWSAPLYIDPATVRRMGLDAASALAPDSDGRPATFSAFGEAAVFPDKFRFFRLPEMAIVGSAPAVDRVIVSFHLRETSLLDARIRPTDIRAHCAPAVNLFEADAEAVPIDTERAALPLRISGASRRTAGVYAIRYGIASARNGEHPPVLLPDVRRLAAASKDPRCPVVFSTSSEVRTDGDPDVTVTFGERAAALAHDAVHRVAVFRVLATNRSVASRIRAGDLSGEIRTATGALRYSNITPASRYVPAASGDEFVLRVLRAARITEGDRDPLGSLRDTLFQTVPSWIGREEWIRAQHLRIRAIDRFEVDVARRPGANGAVLRGYGYRLVVDEAAFRGPGDIALLGATLGEAFARAVPVAMFAELRVEGRRGTFAATFGGNPT